jgi:hypothetical protein
MPSSLLLNEIFLTRQTFLGKKTVTTPRIAKRVEEIKRQASNRAQRAERTKRISVLLIAVGLTFWAELPIALFVYQAFLFWTTGIWHWFNVVEALQLVGVRGSLVLTITWEPLRDSVKWLLLDAWAGVLLVPFGFILHLWGQMVREDGKFEASVARAEGKSAQRQALAELELDIRAGSEVAPT